MQNLWIVVAIAVALVLIFFLFRLGSGGIGRFSGRAKVKHGNTEFEGEAGFEESKLGRPPLRTIVKGNKMVGNNQTIQVSRENASVEENLMEGKYQDLIVSEADNKSPKSENEDNA
jgi:hypothetical protein